MSLLNRFSLLVLALPLLVATGASASEGGTRTYDRDYKGVKQMFAEIKTHEGSMKFELYFKQSPNTVANFAHLADSGFYNGLVFHRIIQGFMAQGGDPAGDGTGGPGWTIKDEPNELKHVAGVLSMANAGANTGGSQFFITHLTQPHLDGNHTVFGKIVEGFDVVSRLERGDPILAVKITEVK